MAAEGLDPEWFTAPVASVALFPQDRDQLHLSFHPPRRPNRSARARKNYGDWNARTTSCARRNLCPLSRPSKRRCVDHALGIVLFTRKPQRFSEPNG